MRGPHFTEDVVGSLRSVLHRTLHSRMYGYQGYQAPFSDVLLPPTCALTTACLASLSQATATHTPILLKRFLFFLQSDSVLPEALWRTSQS